MASHNDHTKAAVSTTGGAAKRRAGSKSGSAGKPELQVVPLAELPADEQALLAAYRTMDDRARRITLRCAIRKAEEWPAATQPGPRVTALWAEEQALLSDFLSMDMDARHDVSCMVAAIARQNPWKDPRPTLRLIVGGRA
jgi:hypothetical protein